jgi:hypothetical protein
VRKQHRTSSSSFYVFYFIVFFGTLVFPSRHVCVNVRGVRYPTISSILLVCVCVATWQIPVKNEETKTVCCLCCQSGPITAIAWLPKSGYVPGETILFCGRVDNKSRSRLLHTSVRLVEVYTPISTQANSPDSRLYVYICWKETDLS